MSEDLSIHLKLLLIAFFLEFFGADEAMDLNLFIADLCSL